MHRFFIPQPYSDTMTIMGVDARHIYTVLRMQCGSRVQIVSDDGVTALAEIADANESVAVSYTHLRAHEIMLLRKLSAGRKLLKRLRNRASVILYQWCSQYRRWNRCLLIIPVTVN